MIAGRKPTYWSVHASYWNHAPDILRFLYPYLYMRYFCQSVATCLVDTMNTWGLNLRMRRLRLALQRLTLLPTTLFVDFLLAVKAAPHA